MHQIVKAQRPPEAGAVAGVGAEPAAGATARTQPGLRESSKQQRRARIVAAAVRLVSERGLDAVTADDIAGAAEVSRATFFRYFDSKEAAVVVGFYENRLTALTAAVAAQPAELDPRCAMVGAVRELAAGFSRFREFDLMQGRIVVGSTVLRARALEFQDTYVDALAEVLAPRFDPLPGTDLRPRFLAAQAVSILRITVDQWVADDGRSDLPAMVRSGLAWLGGEPARRPHPVGDGRSAPALAT